MTNEQTIAALWQAYQAGYEPTSDHIALVDLHQTFNNWLKENYPQLLEVHVSKPMYYHEYLCKADIRTPNRTGTCDGIGDPTKERKYQPAEFSLGRM